MAHGYAKEKFFGALLGLVSENKPLAMRLSYAAEALIRLRLDHLPERMRDDFQKLKDDLTQTPLRWPIGDFIPRKVTPREARRLANQVLEMYTKLLGGLT